MSDNDRTLPSYSKDSKRISYSSTAQLGRTLEETDFIQKSGNQSNDVKDTRPFRYSSVSSSVSSTSENAAMIKARVQARIDEYGMADGWVPYKELKDNADYHSSAEHKEEAENRALVSKLPVHTPHILVNHYNGAQYDDESGQLNLWDETYSVFTDALDLKRLYLSDPELAREQENSTHDLTLVVSESDFSRKSSSIVAPPIPQRDDITQHAIPLYRSRLQTLKRNTASTVNNLLYQCKQEITNMDFVIQKQVDFVCRGVRDRLSKVDQMLESKLSEFGALHIVAVDEAGYMAPDEKDKQWYFCRPSSKPTMTLQHAAEQLVIRQTDEVTPKKARVFEIDQLVVGIDSKQREMNNSLNALSRSIQYYEDVLQRMSRKAAKKDEDETSTTSKGKQTASGPRKDREDLVTKRRSLLTTLQENTTLLTSLNNEKMQLLSDIATLDTELQVRHATCEIQRHEEQQHNEHAAKELQQAIERIWLDSRKDRVDSQDNAVEHLVVRSSEVSAQLDRKTALVRELYEQLLVLEGRRMDYHNHVYCTLIHLLVDGSCLGLHRAVYEGSMPGVEEGYEASSVEIGLFLLPVTEKERIAYKQRAMVRLQTQEERIESYAVFANTHQIDVPTIELDNTVYPGVYEDTMLSTWTFLRAELQQSQHSHVLAIADVNLLHNAVRSQTMQKQAWVEQAWAKALQRGKVIKYHTALDALEVTYGGGSNRGQMLQAYNALPNVIVNPIVAEPVLVKKGNMKKGNAIVTAPVVVNTPLSPVALPPPVTVPVDNHRRALLDELQSVSTTVSSTINTVLQKLLSTAPDLDTAVAEFHNCLLDKDVQRIPVEQTSTYNITSYVDEATIATGRKAFQQALRTLLCPLQFTAKEVPQEPMSVTDKTKSSTMSSSIVYFADAQPLQEDIDITQYLLERSTVLYQRMTELSKLHNQQVTDDMVPTVGSLIQALSGAPFLQPAPPAPPTTPAPSTLRKDGKKSRDESRKRDEKTLSRMRSVSRKNELPVEEIKITVEETIPEEPVVPVEPEVVSLHTFGIPFLSPTTPIDPNSLLHTTLVGMEDHAMICNLLELIYQYNEEHKIDNNAFTYTDRSVQQHPLLQASTNQHLTYDLSLDSLSFSSGCVNSVVLFLKTLVGKAHDISLFILGKLALYQAYSAMQSRVMLYTHRNALYKIMFGYPGLTDSTNGSSVDHPDNQITPETIDQTVLEKLLPHVVRKDTHAWLVLVRVTNQLVYGMDRLSSQMNGVLRYTQTTVEQWEAVNQHFLLLAKVYNEQQKMSVMRIDEYTHELVVIYQKMQHIIANSPSVDRLQQETKDVLRIIQPADGILRDNMTFLLSFARQINGTFMKEVQQQCSHSSAQSSAISMVWSQDYVQYLQSIFIGGYHREVLLILEYTLHVCKSHCTMHNTLQGNMNEADGTGSTPVQQQTTAVPTLDSMKSASIMRKGQTPAVPVEAPSVIPTVDSIINLMDSLTALCLETNYEQLPAEIIPDYIPSPSYVNLNVLYVNCLQKLRDQQDTLSTEDGGQRTKPNNRKRTNLTARAAKQPQPPKEKPVSRSSRGRKNAPSVSVEDTVVVLFNVGSVVLTSAQSVDQQIEILSKALTTVTSAMSVVVDMCRFFLENRYEVVMHPHISTDAWNDTKLIHLCGGVMNGSDCRSKVINESIDCLHCLCHTQIVPFDNDQYKPVKADIRNAPRNGEFPSSLVTSYSFEEELKLTQVVPFSALLLFLSEKTSTFMTVSKVVPRILASEDKVRLHARSVEESQAAALLPLTSNKTRSKESLLVKETHRTDRSKTMLRAPIVVDYTAIPLTFTPEGQVHMSMVMYTEAIAQQTTSLRAQCTLVFNNDVYSTHKYQEDHTLTLLHFPNSTNDLFLDTDTMNMARTALQRKNKMDTFVEGKDVNLEDENSESGFYSDEDEDEEHYYNTKMQNDTTKLQIVSAATVPAGAYTETTHVTDSYFAKQKNPCDGWVDTDNKLLFSYPSVSLVHCSFLIKPFFASFNCALSRLLEHASEEASATASTRMEGIEKYVSTTSVKLRKSLDYTILRVVEPRSKDLNSNREIFERKVDKIHEVRDHANETVTSLLMCLNEKTQKWEQEQLLLLQGVVQVDEESNVHPSVSKKQTTNDLISVHAQIKRSSAELVREAAQTLQTCLQTTETMLSACISLAVGFVALCKCFVPAFEYSSHDSRALSEAEYATLDQKCPLEAYARAFDDPGFAMDFQELLGNGEREVSIFDRNMYTYLQYPCYFDKFLGDVTYRKRTVPKIPTRKLANPIDVVIEKMACVLENTVERNLTPSGVSPFQFLKSMYESFETHPLREVVDKDGLRLFVQEEHTDNTNQASMMLHPVEFELFFKTLSSCMGSVFRSYQHTKNLIETTRSQFDEKVKELLTLVQSDMSTLGSFTRIRDGSHPVYSAARRALGVSVRSFITKNVTEEEEIETLLQNQSDYTQGHWDVLSPPPPPPKVIIAPPPAHTLPRVPIVRNGVLPEKPRLKEQVLSKISAKVIETSLSTVSLSTSPSTSSTEEIDTPLFIAPPVTLAMSYLQQLKQMKQPPLPMTSTSINPNALILRGSNVNGLLSTVAFPPMTLPTSNTSVSTQHVYLQSEKAYKMMKIAHVLKHRLRSRMAYLHILPTFLSDNTDKNDGLYSPSQPRTNLSLSVSPIVLGVASGGETATGNRKKDSKPVVTTVVVPVVPEPELRTKDVPWTKMTPSPVEEPSLSRVMTLCNTLTSSISNCALQMTLSEFAPLVQLAAETKGKANKQNAKTSINPTGPTALYCAHVSAAMLFVIMQVATVQEAIPKGLDALYTWAVNSTTSYSAASIPSVTLPVSNTITLVGTSNTQALSPSSITATTGIPLTCATSMTSLMMTSVYPYNNGGTGHVLPNTPSTSKGRVNGTKTIPAALLDFDLIYYDSVYNSHPLTENTLLHLEDSPITHQVKSMLEPSIGVKIATVQAAANSLLDLAGIVWTALLKDITLYNATVASNAAKGEKNIVETPLVAFEKPKSFASLIAAATVLQSLQYVDIVDVTQRSYVSNIPDALCSVKKDADIAQCSCSDSVIAAFQENNVYTVKKGDHMESCTSPLCILMHAKDYLVASENSTYKNTIQEAYNPVPVGKEERGSKSTLKATAEDANTTFTVPMSAPHVYNGSDNILYVRADYHVSDSLCSSAVSTTSVLAPAGVTNHVSNGWSGTGLLAIPDICFVTMYSFASLCERFQPYGLYMSGASIAVKNREKVKKRKEGKPESTKSTKAHVETASVTTNCSTVLEDDSFLDCLQQSGVAVPADIIAALIDNKCAALDTVWPDADVKTLCANISTLLRTPSKLMAIGFVDREEITPSKVLDVSSLYLLHASAKAFQSLTLSQDASFTAYANKTLQQWTHQMAGIYLSHATVKNLPVAAIIAGQTMYYPSLPPILGCGSVELGNLSSYLRKAQARVLSQLVEYRSIVPKFASLALYDLVHNALTTSEQIHTNLLTYMSQVFAFLTPIGETLRDRISPFAGAQLSLENPQAPYKWLIDAGGQELLRSLMVNRVLESYRELVFILETKLADTLVHALRGLVTSFSALHGGMILPQDVSGAYEQLQVSNIGPSSDIITWSILPSNKVESKVEGNKVESPRTSLPPLVNVDSLPVSRGRSRETGKYNPTPTLSKLSAKYNKVQHRLDTTSALHTIYRDTQHRHAPMLEPLKPISRIPTPPVCVMVEPEVEREAEIVPLVLLEPEIVSPVHSSKRRSVASGNIGSRKGKEPSSPSPTKRRGKEPEPLVIAPVQKCYSPTAYYHIVPVDALEPAIPHVQLLLQLPTDTYFLRRAMMLGSTLYDRLQSQVVGSSHVASQSSLAMQNNMLAQMRVTLQAYTASCASAFSVMEDSNLAGQVCRDLILDTRNPLSASVQAALVRYTHTVMLGYLSSNIEVRSDIPGALLDHMYATYFKLVDQPLTGKKNINKVKAKVVPTKPTVVNGKTSLKSPTSMAPPVEPQVQLDILVNAVTKEGVEYSAETEAQNAITLRSNLTLLNSVNNNNSVENTSAVTSEQEQRRCSSFENQLIKASNTYVARYLEEAQKRIQTASEYVQKHRDRELELSNEWRMLINTMNVPRPE